MTMIETVFTILVAGCAHDGAACTVVTEDHVSAASIEVCEGILDDRMATEDALWPVYSGICIESDKVRVSDLPQGWEFPNLSVASR